MDEPKLGAKIVVIGGGTGSFTVLSGLKNYATHITALVNMADDGGSTGQLRDELGALPPGDVRQCLVALSNSPQVRDLFNYRFEDGSMKGHAFGNIFLTALEKMTGSFAKAVETASEVLNVAGRVEPITFAQIKLCARDEAGAVTKGEFAIVEAKFKGKPELWLEPKAIVQPQAVSAIMSADLVVIAPGSLYSSLAPTLLVEGVAEALRETKAKKVYVCNLVTKPGQTDEYSVCDFAEEIERFAGRRILDYVLFNTTMPSESLLKKYAKEGEFAVNFNTDDLQDKHYRAKGADLLATDVWTGVSESDAISHTRSFIRHDGDKVARQLMKIYFS